MTAATVDTRTKAIGYVRVSTLKQGQNGFGLDAQRDAIESYCAANDLRLVAVIPDVMSTRAQTGCMAEPQLWRRYRRA